MAQLDALLQALIDRSAQELLLHADQRPVFRIGGELRAVSQQALNRSQISALITEMADAVQTAAIAEGRQASFVYTLADGRSFLCEIGDAAEGGFRARLVPDDGRAVPAAAPLETSPAPVATEPATPPPPPVSPQGAPRIDGFLRRMVELEASDLHLSADEIPMLRVHGDMMRFPGATSLDPGQTLGLIQEIMPERNRIEFEETNDSDFAHEIEGLARFRVNAFVDRKGPGAVFRVIPAEILTSEQLGLSKAISTCAVCPRGWFW